MVHINKEWHTEKETSLYFTNTQLKCLSFFTPLCCNIAKVSFKIALFVSYSMPKIMGNMLFLSTNIKNYYRQYLSAYQYPTWLLYLVKQLQNSKIDFVCLITRTDTLGIVHPLSCSMHDLIFFIVIVDRSGNLSPSVALCISSPW